MSGSDSPIAGVPPLTPRTQRSLETTIDAALNGFETSRAVDVARLREQLTRELTHKVHQMSCWSLVADMRTRSARGELSGDTPRARFHDFTSRVLPRDGWEDEFTAAFPVLAQQVARETRSWAAHIRTVLARFVTDQHSIPLMTAERSTHSDDRLIAIHGPLGDPHRGGQSVCRLELADGRSVIYKPRSIAAELTFCAVLRSLQDTQYVDDLRLPRSIGREQYAWCEDVKPCECQHLGEVDSYYQRLGSLLCALYVLGARDVWWENVIAVGPHPYLIDLECMMTPVLQTNERVLVTTGATNLLRDSVLASGILPRWTRGTDVDSGISTSALYTAEHAPTALADIRWSNLGRDDLFLVAGEPTGMVPDSHLPTLHGVRHSVQAFSASFLRGFENAYRAFLNARDEFLSPRGPLKMPADTTVRVLIRATRVYERIHFVLLHSDVLKSRHDATGLLESLAATSILPQAVLTSEMRQLRNGDIPYFVMNARSTALLDDRGQRVWTNAASQTPLSGVVERLARLSMTDYERQRMIITAALQAHEGAVTESVAVPASTRRADSIGSSRAIPSTDELLATAVSIGDELLAVGVDDGQSLSWLGVAASRDDKWSLTGLDLGLDYGAEGIGMFFLYLYVTTGEGRFRDAVERIMTGICLPAIVALTARGSRVPAPAVGRAGPMRFPASTLYFLMHVDRVLGKSTLTPKVLDASVAFLGRVLTARLLFDFRYGIAGLATLLLAVHEQTRHEAALAVARACGAALVARAETGATGAYWRQPRTGGLLLGFAEGATGVSWTLLRLSCARGMTEFRETAALSFVFEQALISQLAADATRSSCASQSACWSRGALGSIYGHLMCCRSQASHGSATVASVPRALRAFLPSLSQDVHDSLYDGLLGAIDITRVIAGVTADDIMDDAWRNALRRLWSRYRRTLLWRVRSPRGCAQASFGLLDGMAGVGYGLLRLATPVTVPQFLTLSGADPMCPCL